MSDLHPLPILVSWSGGKDSAWMLHVLRQQPAWQVCGAVTTVTAGYDRISMHGIRRSILAAQAAAAAMPVIEATIEPHADNTQYETAFADALQRARATWPSLHHIAFGDLFLEDVRDYRVQLCARLGWIPVFPLFGSDTVALARRMHEGGLRATLCCVDTTQLPASFAGCDFDPELLSGLPPGVDPCGEHGEFHTCVHAGPMFARPLRLRRGESVLRDGRFQYVDLELDVDDEHDATPAAESTATAHAAHADHTR